MEIVTNSEILLIHSVQTNKPPIASSAALKSEITNLRQLYHSSKVMKKNEQTKKSFSQIDD